LTPDTPAPFPLLFLNLSTSAWNRKSNFGWQEILVSVQSILRRGRLRSLTRAIPRSFGGRQQRDGEPDSLQPDRVRILNPGHLHEGLRECVHTSARDRRSHDRGGAKSEWDLEEQPGCSQQDGADAGFLRSCNVRRTRAWWWPRKRISDDRLRGGWPPVVGPIPPPRPRKDPTTP
jgi:hypothetical protein